MESFSLKTEYGGLEDPVVTGGTPSYGPALGLAGWTNQYDISL